MRRTVLLAGAASVALLVDAATALACPPPPNPQMASVVRSAASAAQVPDLAGNDPFYYTSGLDPRPTTTHSKIPHLPAYSGFMHTNDTFRFVNVNEQVLTMIGEGKHGLWRVQENGMVREYLRRGASGLPADADPLAPANRAVLERDYSHYLPEEGFDGYKDPFEPVNAAGRRNFVDLPITHPKYRDRYRSHVAIDLPHWYCTMSQDNYREAARVMGFAFAQDGANRVGPLGRRAGLDIRELYTNVLRLEPFPDARVWVNVGDETNVHWKAIDTSRTRAEYYVYERPFFNVPYLFLTVVLDNPDNRDFRYVRPDGPYYRHLAARGTSGLKTEVTLAPRFHVDRGVRPVTGTKLYGVHHPNRPADFGATGGGACPMRGGDWGDYPDPSGGAGWPTQYEEVTPLCDGVLVDIKLYANLDGASWDSEDKYLANAGAGTRDVTYTVKPGRYGTFSDPYHTRRDVENPQVADIGPNVRLRYPTVRGPVGYTRVP